MSTRERFVATASRLLQEKGYEATTVGEIAGVGGLPIGSLYHHFPGGKEELGAAAVLHGARDFSEVLATSLDSAADPAQALAACATTLADRLESSDWRSGCPVATVALETVHRSELLQAAAQEALSGWVELVVRRLVDLGVPPDEAADLGQVTIAVLEGAELMARVGRSRRPLDTAARWMAHLAHGGDHRAGDRGRD